MLKQRELPLRPNALILYSYFIVKMAVTIVGLPPFLFFGDSKVATQGFFQCPDRMAYRTDPVLR
jgi:hypothetical protein